MSPIKSRKHALGFTAGTSRPTPGTSLTAALFTSLALGAVLPAHAQSTGGPSTDDADQRKTTTLDKVEVQGERERQYSGEVSSPKFTQPLVDTTQTVNVIGADLFTEQGATTLTDVLRNSPGVGTFYVGENGNTATGDTIYMRGFDSSSSIYVDGVRDLGSISRDVFNIQQVEVTKGPAGSDYGRSAPTGSINLASKRAGLVDGNSASVSYGSAGQRRLTADFNKALSASSAFRINLMAQDSGVPGRDEVQNKRWGIAPSFAFGLDGATRVYLNLLHVDQDNVPDGGVPTIGLPGYSSPDPTRPQIANAPRVDSSNFYGTTSDHDDVTADMATLIVEHDFSDAVSLHNITRWGRTEQDYLLTAFMLSKDATRFQTPDINDPSTWLVLRSLPTFKDQRNAILTNQTNLRATLRAGGIEHDLSAGLELSREKLDATGWAPVTGTAWPAANLYDPNPEVSGLQWRRSGLDREGRTDTVAAYLFDTLKLNEQWQLNAGVRLDRYDTDYNAVVACTVSATLNNCGGQPVGTAVPFAANASDTLFNWKLGVLFKPTANGSVYANYATSQQPPGGGALELNGNPNNANNPIYDPQKSRTAEIGTKWNLAGERLLLTAAAYDTRVDNEVVQDQQDPAVYYQNGSKRVRGIELSATGSITEAWSVSAGFTTMDAKVLEGPAVSNDGTAVLSYTPDKAFTAWTSYVFPSGLTIGGGARYSGEMKRGRDGAVGTPAFVEDYWVFDAVASYAVNDSLTLRLNANNVFDEEYVAGINKSGYRYSPGAPRNFLLTATFRF